MKHKSSFDHTFIYKIIYIHIYIYIYIHYDVYYFYFRRKWIVPTSSTVLSIHDSEREKILEQKLCQMEQKFQEFQEKQNQMLQQMLINQQSPISKKGKGRGKNSQTFQKTNDNFAFQAAVQAEAQKRLRSFIESSEGSSYLSEDPQPGPSQKARRTNSIASNWTEDLSRADPDPPANTKTIYIKKIEV